MLTTLEWEQRRHLDELGELWGRLAPLLQARHRFAGGVSWKEVKGYTYLTRYRTDPVTHVKKFDYLGNRNAETERTYADFLSERAEVDAKIEPLERRMEMSGRVAKALRLGRLPTPGADALRAIWRAGLNENFVVTDGANVAAYELQAGVFDNEWPVHAEELHLMSLAPQLDDDDIDDLRRALVSVDRSYRYSKQLSAFVSSADEYIVHVDAKRDMEDVFTARGGALVREAVDWSLALPSLTLMAIGFNGRPTSASFLDPRAFLVLGCCAADPNSTMRQQAEAVARIIPPDEMPGPIPWEFAELSPILQDAIGNAGVPRM